MKIKTLAFALAISTAMTGVANAVVFTKTYDVNSTLADGSGLPPSASGLLNVTQTFVVNFDPEKNDKPVITYYSNAGGAFANALTLISHRVDNGQGRIYFTLQYDGQDDSFGTQFSTDLLGGSPEFMSTVAIGEFGVLQYEKGSVSLRLPTVENGSGAPGVPEPATWAMMLVGFGFVGGAVRYRRKSMAIRFA